MATDPQVKVKVSADTANYERNLTKAASATDKVAAAQDDLKQSAVNTRVAWAALGTAMTIAGAKMVGVLRDSIRAASDLNESASKTKVVFGDSADAIDDFAATSASSLGMSKKAAYDAASMFALFGKSAGLVGDELVGFSTELVQLSSDLASFFNTSPEDAMQAIGSALRGETEAIRRYNVLLDAATLQTRAFSMGLISTTKQALTPQQKVLAAHAEILAQTSDAQGDFARTSDGLANSQRKMSAAIENAKASLGEALLPIMADAANAVAKLAEWFALLPGPVRAAVAGISALLAGFALFSPAIVASVQGIKMLIDAYTAHKAAALTSAAANTTFVGSLKGVGAAQIVKSLGLVGVAIAAVGAVAFAAKKNIDAWQDKSVRNMAEAMKEAAAAGRDFGDAMEITLGGGRVVKGFDEMAAAMLSGSDVVKKQLVPAFDALDMYLDGLPIGEAKDKFDDLSNTWVGTGGKLADLNTLLPEFTGKLGDATDANGELTDATGSAEQALLDEAKAAEEAERKIKDAAEAMWSAIDAAVALGRSQDNLRGMTGRLTAATDANGRSLDKRSAAGRKNRAVIFDEIDAIVENSRKVYDNALLNGKTAPEALAKARAALEKNTGKLQTNAEKAGFASSKVQGLINKYAKIPRDINTDVTVRFRTQNLAAVQGAINKLKTDRALALIQGGAATGGKIGGTGTGTSDSNLIRVSRGEWVINAAAAQKFGDGFMSALNSGNLAYASNPTPTAGGGGSSGPIVVNLTLDGRTVQRSLIDLQRHTGRQVFPLN